MWFRNLAAAGLMSLLAACGGGGGGSGTSSSNDGTAAPQAPPPPNCTYVAGAEPAINDNGSHPTAQEAARFLAQASFGPREASINALTQSSYASWLNHQFALQPSAHLTCVDMELARAAAAGQGGNQDFFFQSWWGQAVTGPDQLRQRVAFALSQIFVVSFEGNLSDKYRSVASYYDMLGRNAFGNYRQLLEGVSLHPAMGMYLSHLRNQKEDPARGRVPDENYAREVMQLFSIGLYELNTDGTVKMSGGRPIETYTNDDVSGLARVFTGYSWAGPDNSNARFTENNSARDPDRHVLPMQGYPQYHSISQKSFLGTTIAAQGSASVASMQSDLKTALDRLYNHPNVGPFIGRQMIQRLVTSNPSAAYVGRVAAAFNTGTAHGFGNGVRGDMKAVIAAVLLDPEARPASPAAGEGKLREPVLRLANWARAFNAGSASGSWRIGNTDSVTGSLGQTPMRSPSVFNYYRPGYLPPNTNMGTAGLVAPEMQITHESSVAGYLNFMRDVVDRGVGATVSNARDVRPDYSAEIALAGNSDALIDRVNLLLMRGAMKPSTRTAIKTAVDPIAISTTNATNADTARRQRVYIAVYLAMAAPEYLTQK
ncbi:DUF1800 domain-containing protein [Uliginosibacterium sp. H1]|uniref:DUF1800 domain-containing protein n=1 Tax=Uliginosibacterium sp. H1 TaxID=3114757 RepID=UPI002E181C4C|nr:DUF1800 domain-containing protein [Uliginosibacterium sp. H1]